ncbi:MAG: DUF4863 family protein [Burkholderiales bacterium]|nr:DUF4863 family protein [Burkholderiales bacterium]MCC7115728.1 DUF4863 family protein [Burkholderiales bacterium]
MNVETFTGLIANLTARLEGRRVEPALADHLNATAPADGPEVVRVAAACREAIAAGWMCNREAGGIRYGRVIKPGPATHGHSVDVVDMTEVVGPHHRHPAGEIDLVIPVDPTARFDGHGAGWVVYGPGSAHSPTVTGGRALVLYLLPGGAIEFSPPA